MERNRYLTIFKNYSAWTLILISPALLAMEFGLLLYSFISGFWKEKLKMYSYFLRIKTWKMLTKKRYRIQNLRKVSDKHITSCFVGSILFQEMNNIILRKIANPIFSLYWKLIKAFL